MIDKDWIADLARYQGGKKIWVNEQSLWAIWVYRHGRRIDSKKKSMTKTIQTKIYWLIFKLVETITGISIPKECKIGPGLKIWHFGGIFINPDCEIGSNCTLRQGVTLGNREPDGECPVLGNNVELGAYAQILGGIKIGDGARIGAMSVVLTDIPPGCTAVGNPARIIRKEKHNNNHNP